MTRPRRFKEDPKTARDTLMQACEIADQIHKLEEKLIESLREIDHHTYYVRCGFNSLRGFCVHGLKFSRTQGQRITTEVRRSLTLVDDGQLRDLKTSRNSH